MADRRRESARRIAAGVAAWKRRLARLDFLITTFALCWLLARFLVFALRRTG